MTHTISSQQEMQAFADRMASDLVGGEVFGLVGELGSGKTTFVQSLARSLGVQDPVRSPTFTLLQIYKTAHPTIKHLVHIDLYRLQERKNVIEEIGLDEWLNRKDAIVCIEWPTEEIRTRIPTLRSLSFSYGKAESDRIIES